MKSFNWASIAKVCENQDSRMKIKIEGLLRSEAFQKARLCARKLHGHLPDRFAKPEINEMLQVAWHDRFEEIRRCFGGKSWSLRRPVVVFIDGKLIGDDVAFIRHVGKTYAFNLPICEAYYENLIAQEYRRFIRKLGRKHVYFTFTMDDSVIGSFLIMLYTDLVPRTCEHFARLCTGYESKNAWGTRLSYKNTRVHRIVANGWIQIGDIFEANEDLAESALNEITMRDESYCVPHDRRGIVSMANDGKQNNRDQFVVSLRPNQWMDRRYVAFGDENEPKNILKRGYTFPVCLERERNFKGDFVLGVPYFRQLIEGANTLKRIENTPAYYEAPLQEILISDCGEYSFGSETAAKVEAEDRENSEATKNDCFEDSLDDRDVASLVMFERYEKGLYSLSTDCLPSDLQRQPENE